MTYAECCASNFFFFAWMCLLPRKMTSEATYDFLGGDLESECHHPHFFTKLIEKLCPKQCIKQQPFVSQDHQMRRLNCIFQNANCLSGHHPIGSFFRYKHCSKTVKFFVKSQCVHLNNKMYKEFSRKKCEFSVRNFLVNSQFFLWFWWIIWIFRPRITFLYLIVSKTAPLILEFFTVPRAMNCRVGENGGLSKVSKFISSTPPTHDMISTGASSFQEGNPMQKLSLE